MVTLVYMATLGSTSGSGGGFSGSVTTSQISDMTAVGKQVATAATAAAARTAIGAGTSNLVIGTTAGTAKDGAYAPAWTEITAKPTFATVATTGAYADLTGKPTYATVATTGAYADLTGKPTLATVATTGAYADLTGKPTIPTTAGEVGAVPTTRTVNGQALNANVTLTKTDVGLGNVDNVSDVNKPVSTPQANAYMSVTPFGYVLRYNTSTGWPARTTKPSWWTGSICYAADDVSLAQGVVPYPTDRIVNDTLLYRAGVMVGG